MAVMKKLRMFVAQESVVAASCLIAGVGSTKANSKLGKKHFVFDENRRNTYNQSHPSASGQESSVLTTFDGERKQLMAVGLHSDYGYARSLARFAANLGPVTWNIATN